MQLNEFFLNIISFTGVGFIKGLMYWVNQYCLG